MSDEIELEPDRHRLHDLVRLTWRSAQQPGAEASPPVPEQTRAGAVSDEDIAGAGPYSVEQIREHLEAEQEGTYTLERDGDTIFVRGVQDEPLT